MSKNVKIALIVLAIFFGFCLLCSGAGYFWAQSSVGDLEQMGEEVDADAKAFAAGRDDLACIDESLRRVEQCSEFGITCKARAALFLDFCARQARHTDAFCEGVPTPTEFTEEVTQTVTWSLAECDRRGRPDQQTCADHIKEVVKVCKRRKGIQ